jgi:hypothetical protein
MINTGCTKPPTPRPAPDVVGLKVAKNRTRSANVSGLPKSSQLPKRRQWREREQRCAGSARNCAHLSDVLEGARNTHQEQQPAEHESCVHEWAG